MPKIELLLDLLIVIFAVGIVIAVTGCASGPTVSDELGGRHATDNTLRCDVEVNGRCVQWGRTRSLRSVKQES